MVHSVNRTVFRGWWFWYWWGYYWRYHRALRVEWVDLDL